MNIRPLHDRIILILKEGEVLAVITGNGAVQEMT